MKKQIAGLLMIFLLAGISWAQGTKAPFDAKKSQEELEIMKGILGTTLSFVLQKPDMVLLLQKNNTSKQTVWRFTNINAFYLAGQGAVFIIPTSNLPGRINEAGNNISELYQGLLTQSLIVTPFAQAKEGSSSVRTGPTEADRENLRKKIEEDRLKLKRAEEDAEANRERYAKELKAVEAYLVETLASYGDSMTTVKPSEHINFVLTDDGLGGALVNLNSKRSPSSTHIISAEKSWITDYKAGKLTLDGFKQKVLQYSE
jgi:hypothetical protein